MRYTIHPRFSVLLLATTVGAVAWRAVDAVRSTGIVVGSPLTVFGFQVILPAILAVLLTRLPSDRSPEGTLMRVGTLMQLLLVILLPGWGLHLILGLPVVFLLVEVFSIRLPDRLRLPIERRIVSAA